MRSRCSSVARNQPGLTQSDIRAQGAYARVPLDARAHGTSRPRWPDRRSSGGRGIPSLKRYLDEQKESQYRTCGLTSRSLRPRNDGVRHAEAARVACALRVAAVAGAVLLASSPAAAQLPGVELTVEGGGRPVFTEPASVKTAMELFVRFDAPVSGTVMVRYGSTPIDATPGSDYLPYEGTLTFHEGDVGLPLIIGQVFPDDVVGRKVCIRQSQLLHAHQGLNITRASAGSTLLVQRADRRRPHEDVGDLLHGSEPPELGFGERVRAAERDRAPLTDEEGSPLTPGELEPEARLDLVPVADWKWCRASRGLALAPLLQILDGCPHLLRVPRRPVVSGRQPRCPVAAAHGDQTDCETFRAVVLAQGQELLRQGDRRKLVHECRPGRRCSRPPAGRATRSSSAPRCAAWTVPP